MESKEGMPVGSQSRVIAKVTFQSFFKMFDRLSGMTGTAVSSAGELEKVYGLEVRVREERKTRVTEPPF